MFSELLWRKRLSYALPLGRPTYSTMIDASVRIDRSFIKSLCRPTSESTPEIDNKRTIKRYVVISI